MFVREHHLDIALVLSNLDASLFRAHHCYFGGGTAIVLLNNEFRESVDIDFLVSDSESFRDLRLMAKAGFDNFFRTGAARIKPLRDVKIDQYGIRAQLDVGERGIKFEIISEGRIKFDTPGIEHHVCGIATLTALDLVASKLLANSDRWADAGVFCRDLIDLAMLQPSMKLFCAGMEKAEAAYGNSVGRDLLSAIERLRLNPAILERSISALGIQVPQALLWQRIKALGKLVEKAG